MTERDVNMGEIDKEIKEQHDKVMGQVRAGSYIKSLRMDCDLSLAALGKELGVSAAYLSNVEQGVKTMSDYFVREIADFFKVDENIFFNLLGRVPLLAREQLKENKDIQSNPIYGCLQSQTITPYSGKFLYSSIIC